MQWTPVHSGIWKATIGTPEPHTPVSMRAIEPLADAIDALSKVTDPPHAAPYGEITRRGCRVAISLEKSELMYGFGLQLLSFQQRGKKRIIRVNADPKGDSGDSHAPAPFYVTTAGYGILVDTLRHADFYCGEIHPKPTTAIPLEQDAVNTPGDTQSRTIDVQSEVRIEVPRATGVDVYLFAGPSMLDAVKRYILFSGGGVMPPQWALGFWYRPEMHDGQEEVLALAREFRQSRIPCDVIGLEPGWQTHAYSCSYVWDKHRFPDPKKFIGSAAQQGYRVNLWEHAYTHPSSPVFGELVPYSGDIAVWEGLVPDFAGEPARKIFGDYHGKELVEIGISGFKLDECDSSDYTGGWSFPDFSQFPSGLDGEQMHAIFGLKYQQAIWQQFRQRGLETFNLVRSSGALSAPYPFVLYSDLYDHRQFVRGVVNSGFSGLLWCPEVRDAVSEEDLIRRLQGVIFSPLAMVNAWYIKNPPWKQIDREKNNADQLGENWQRLEERCREIIGWRMQLLPYLAAAFRRYATDGTPPFRALILDYPNDATVVEVDDAYMVGDRMLVAPLFAGEPGRKLTLPRGEWHDFWTGKRVAAGQAIEIPASTENIPVFVKAGSVIPMAAITGSTGDAEAKDWTVQVYGDGSLPWTGEGITIGWDASSKKGSLQQQGSRIRISGWQQMG